MSKNGNYTLEDCDFYTTLFVLFVVGLNNFASVFKMSYDLVYSHCGLPVCGSDFDAVLIHFIRIGTPLDKIIKQTSTSLPPPNLRPATSSANSTVGLGTALVVVPLVVVVLGCLGCMIYCKIKTG